MNQDNDAQHDDLNDELRAEYDETTLTHGVRGTFIQRLAQGSNVVRLDPNIAAAFPTKEAVNDALRLLLQATKIAVQHPA